MNPPVDPGGRPQRESRRGPTTPRLSQLRPAPVPRMLGANGQRVLLMVLLGMWALIMVARWPRHQLASARAVILPAAKAPQSPTGVVPLLPRLKGELVDLPQAPYTPETSSIFRVPPPPPPVRPVEVVRPAAPPPPPPSDPFQEAAKQLRFLGFMQAGETVTALISQGSEVHVVSVRGVLANRFRVARVTEESALLPSPEGDRQVRLSLQEGTPPGAPGAKR